jgi:hypothetical protein
MNIDTLAHADSIELLAMHHDWFEEYDREVVRLQIIAKESRHDPLPEDFYYEDGPRAYAH